MMMLGPIQVYTRHPNSLKEREYLSVRWRDGKLTVTYVRHDTPDSEEFYSQEWTVECREPLVTERRHPSANLQQMLDDLEHR